MNNPDASLGKTPLAAAAQDPIAFRASLLALQAAVLQAAPRIPGRPPETCAEVSRTENRKAAF